MREVVGADEGEQRGLFDEGDGCATILDEMA